MVKNFCEYIYTLLEKKNSFEGCKFIILFLHNLYFQRNKIKRTENTIINKLFFNSELYLLIRISKD